MKRILVVCSLVGLAASRAIAEAARKQENEQRTYDLIVFEEADMPIRPKPSTVEDFKPFHYASERKGKGEKARNRSNRRGKGWI